MKKLSFLTLVIGIAASSFAQTSNMKITTVKKIKTDEIVSSLKIYNNVEIVLTDDELNEIQIVGEATGVENTQVKISNGELIVTSASEEYHKDRVLVYVPSAFLESVYVHGASTVSSSEVLNKEMLDVTINGTGKSTIKTAGKISMNTIADFPVDPAFL